MISGCAWVLAVLSAQMPTPGKAGTRVKKLNRHHRYTKVGMVQEEQPRPLFRTRRPPIASSGFQPLGRGD